MTLWTAPRCVEPEWLDTLEPDDARAVRSRRDLRRVNAWMLNSGVMAQALIAHWGEGMPRTLLDLGSGDGTFIYRVARRLAPRWPRVTVILLDQQDIVSAETRRASGRLAGPSKRRPPTCSSFWPSRACPRASTSFRRTCSCTISRNRNCRGCLSSWRRGPGCSWPASRAAQPRRSPPAECYGRSAATMSAGTTPSSACAPVSESKSFPACGRSTADGNCMSGRRVSSPIVLRRGEGM